MVQYLFNQNIIIYIFAGLCGLGLILRFILDMVYIRLVKESDNLGSTKNKLLKHMKMKFETCYKLKIGVNNVDTFVDKNVLKHRFCGILLSTWENLSGQLLMLTFLIIPISTVFGVIYDCGQDQILLSGAVGILTGAALIFVDKMINLLSKKNMIRLNLMDYLENFCKVRLEQETSHPESIEQYRREFLQAITANRKAEGSEEASKSELNRRKEAKQRKEEEKRALALKREEEQKRIEEARKEEELRRIEEKKKLAAKRREEELRKLEEEREALELRRAQVKKKAEEKQQLSEKKLQQKEEKEKLLSNIEDEIAVTRKVENKDKLIKEIEQLTAEKENANAEVQVKEPVKAKNRKVNEQEEKLIEDVLKEFFA